MTMVAPTWCACCLAASPQCSSSKCFSRMCCASRGFDTRRGQTSMTIRSGVLIVAGPTGSGKSALAMDAAGTFDGVIINADSMQVYRELRC